jgi:site-specific DNA recombinase
MTPNKASGPVRAAIYCRVSGDEQAREGFSLETQQAACGSKLDELYGRGGCVAELLKDAGYSGGWGFRKPGSGKGRVRPALTELVERVDAGLVDVLVSFTFDRVARSPRVWYELWEDHLKPHEVRVVTVTDGIDTATPQGEMLSEMLAMIGQQYRRQTSVNVSAAHAKRFHDGFHSGQPPYGWRWAEKGKDESGPRRRGIVPDPDQREVVLMMVGSYLEGASLQTIVDRLREKCIPSPRGKAVWEPFIVRLVLLNPVHAGHIRRKDGDIKEGQHHPHRFYDLDTYERVVREMGRRKKFATGTGACRDAPLAGVARCGECGQRLYLHHQRGKYRAYVCARRRRRCKSRPYVRGEFLEPRVIGEIEKMATEPRTLALASKYAERMLRQTTGNAEVELQRRRRRREQMTAEAAKRVRLAAQGKISPETLHAYDADLNRRRQENEARIRELEATDVRARDLRTQLEQVRKSFTDFPGLWKTGTPDERRHLLDRVIEELQVWQETARVRVRLKLRLADPIEFSVPVVSAWRRKRDGLEGNRLSVRQLRVLHWLGQGISPDKIASRLNIRGKSLQAVVRQALKTLGAKTVPEALEKARPFLSEWGEYLENTAKPIHADDGSYWRLNDGDVAVLRRVAAGMSNPEISADLQLPRATVQSRRSRALAKLRSRTWEKGIAAAMERGVIGANEPSPQLLLRVVEEVAAGKHETLVASGQIQTPSGKQIEALRAPAEGVATEEAAEGMKCSTVNLNALRRRLYRCFGATSLRGALERLEEMGLAQPVGWSLRRLARSPTAPAASAAGDSTRGRRGVEREPKRRSGGK